MQKFLIKDKSKTSSFICKGFPSACRRLHSLLLLTTNKISDFGSVGFTHWHPNLSIFFRGLLVWFVDLFKLHASHLIGQLTQPCISFISLAIHFDLLQVLRAFTFTTNSDFFICKHLYLSLFSLKWYFKFSYALPLRTLYNLKFDASSKTKFYFMISKYISSWTWIFIFILIYF